MLYEGRLGLVYFWIIITIKVKGERKGFVEAPDTVIWEEINKWKPLAIRYRFLVSSFAAPKAFSAPLSFFFTPKKRREIDGLLSFSKDKESS